jgi:hypothetical protein
MCKFQAQKAFTWGGVFENNINYILEPHLKSLSFWVEIVLWQNYLSMEYIMILIK